MPHHVFEKAHYIAPVIGFLLHVQQQLSARRERTDHRYVIITTRCMKQWWLTNRRPGPHQRGQQVEGSFVYPDECASLTLGFFLIAGHFSLRQRSISASLRSLARSIGFWVVEVCRMVKTRPCLWPGNCCLVSGILTRCCAGDLPVS